jgi:hypothetical protein
MKAVPYYGQMEELAHQLCEYARAQKVDGLIVGSHQYNTLER